LQTTDVSQQQISSKDVCENLLFDLDKAIIIVDEREPEAQGRTV
jgi:hypothetical protein